MKRIINLAIFLIMAMTVSAQYIDRSRAKRLSTELQFNPFSNNFSTFKMGELKFRYFMDDDNAIRFGIGFGLDNQTETNTKDYNNKVYNSKSYRISSEESEVTTNKMTLNVKVGYEHHIDVMTRLSVYIGAEAGFEANFYSGEMHLNGASESYESSDRSWTDYNQTPSTTKQYSIIQESHTTTIGDYKYEKCTPDESNSNSQSIIANLFTGIDFQLYKGLYIGTELGISFKMGKTEKGSYNYDIQRRTDYSLRYSGSYPSNYKSESSSSTSYEKFDSSTGIRESKTTNSGSASQNDPNYSAVEVSGGSSKFTKLSLYVEPALRIGWRF